MIWYLLGVIQEYCVIINLYNGDLIAFLPEDIEYSLVDIIVFIIATVKCRNFIELSLIFLIFFSHIQWLFHSPFHPWPNWWIADKSLTDIRHRTEYYDTHVMCFMIWLMMFLKYLNFYSYYLYR